MMVRISLNIWNPSRGKIGKRLKIIIRLLKILSCLICMLKNKIKPKTKRLLNTPPKIDDNSLNFR